MIRATARGQLLADILGGHEVRGVSQAAMEHMCLDLAALTPPHFARCNRQIVGYKCALSAGSIGLRPAEAQARAAKRDAKPTKGRR